MKSLLLNLRFFHIKNNEVRHNNFLLLRLFGLQPFSRSCRLQLLPQGEDRLNWQDKTERKLTEGKHALIQNLSSSLELVILGITILLPLCSKLTIWTATGRRPCLPAQPAFLAVLLAMLNPASQSHKENTMCLLFPLPLPTCSTFTAVVGRNQTKQGEEYRITRQTNRDLSKSIWERTTRHYQKNIRVSRSERDLKF